MKTAIAILLLTGAVMAADNDNWQRMKECAAQAEKVAAEKYGEEYELRSHYSPKYKRCFVYLRYVDYGKPSIVEDYLVDAFENFAVAEMVDLYEGEGQPTKRRCRIASGEEPCGVVKAYIDEHLEN